MPLDARKIAHIKAMSRKTHQGRAVPVVLYYRNNGPPPSIQTRTVNAVWKAVYDGDPTLEGPANTQAVTGAPFEVQAMFLASDITLAQLRATLWAQLQTQTDDMPTTKYALVDVEPTSMIPGSTRYFTKWTRQH